MKLLEKHIMRLKIQDNLLLAYTSKKLFTEIKKFYEELKLGGLSCFTEIDFTEKTAIRLLKGFVMKEINDVFYIENYLGISFVLKFHRVKLIV